MNTHAWYVRRRVVEEWRRIWRMERISRALHALSAVPPRVCLRDTIGDTGVDADVGWGRRWRWNGGECPRFSMVLLRAVGCRGERPRAETLASRLAPSLSSLSQSVGRSMTNTMIRVFFHLNVYEEDIHFFKVLRDHRRRWMLLQQTNGGCRDARNSHRLTHSRTHALATSSSPQTGRRTDRQGSEYTDT